MSRVLLCLPEGHSCVSDTSLSPLPPYPQALLTSVKNDGVPLGADTFLATAPPCSLLPPLEPWAGRAQLSFSALTL